ncbi:hypothetical protein [Bradyrhizobium sp. USDA 241]|uniref:hypothetical protein n=1 Tax=Bradyrhizobium sp. USDA 241 TaxID=3377725 RepID=UPI003C73829B
MGAGLLQMPVVAKAQTEASFEIGWTKLPTQTKIENFQLYCREARIVAYSKIDLKNVRLETEAFNVIKSCGSVSAGKIGLLKIITNPSSMVSDFTSHFSECAKDTIAAKADAVGLYTQNEHGDWRRCDPGDVLR